MGDRIREERAAGVKEAERQGFNWTGFFSNHRITLQILFYVLLFYKFGPSPGEVGPLLVWLLLLLPLCVLNVLGTHILTELTAKRKKQAMACLVGA